MKRVGVVASALLLVAMSPPAARAQGAAVSLAPLAGSGASHVSAGGLKPLDGWRQAIGELAWFSAGRPECISPTVAGVNEYALEVDVQWSLSQIDPQHGTRHVALYRMDSTGASTRVAACSAAPVADCVTRMILTADGTSASCVARGCVPGTSPPAVTTTLDMGARAVPGDCFYSAVTHTSTDGPVIAIGVGFKATHTGPASVRIRKQIGILLAELWRGSTRDARLR